MDEVKRGLDKTKEGAKNVQVKKVVNGPVKVKKKSGLSKFAESFFVEDIKSVLSWAVTEVAIPSLKKLFVEFIDNTATSMMYGKAANYQRDSRSVSNVSYRQYWDRSRVRSEPQYAPRSNDIYSYGTIEVSTKDEAENVLNTVNDFISEYHVITVAQFLEMCGIRPRSTDFNYGWTNITNATYARMRDGGYQIRMPKVMLIEQ